MAGQWTYLIDADQVPPGSLVRVQVEQAVLAVCNNRGKYYVVDNRCPHAEGSLSRGTLENGRIICPVHRWPWELTTGLSDVQLPLMRLTFFANEVRDGKLWADLTAPILPEDISWLSPPA